MEDSDFTALDARLTALEQQVARILDFLEPTPAQPPPLPTEPSSDSAALFQLVSIDAKPTEANSVWTKWAWRLTIKNHTAETIHLQAHIQFRDSDSFALDEDTTDALTLRPNQQQVFTNFKMVDASIANLVSSVYATLNRIG